MRQSQILLNTLCEPQQVRLSCTIFCNGDLGNGTIRANHLLLCVFLDRKEKIRNLLRRKFE
jgi:hypothetical protein